MPISRGSEALVLDMTGPMSVHIRSGLLQLRLLQLPRDGRVWSLLLEALGSDPSVENQRAPNLFCSPQFIFGIQALALSMACEVSVDRRVGYNAGEFPAYRNCSIPVTIVSSGHMGV